MSGPEEEDRIERSGRDGGPRVRGALGKLAKRGLAEIPVVQDPDTTLWQLEQFTGRVVKKHGEHSVEAARARVELSLQLGRMGRWDEACTLRDASLAVLRRRQGEDDPETLRIEVSLAIALAHTGRLPQSEAHLEHAASSSLGALGPEDEVTRYAQSKLDEFRQGQANGRT